MNIFKLIFTCVALLGLMGAGCDPIKPTPGPGPVINPVTGCYDPKKCCEDVVNGRCTGHCVAPPQTCP